MSGQSASLSVSEAKTMMKRTEACGDVSEHQGKKNGNNQHEIMKKEKAQGK